MSLPHVAFIKLQKKSEIMYLILFLIKYKRIQNNAIQKKQYEHI